MDSMDTMDEAIFKFLFSIFDLLGEWTGVDSVGCMHESAEAGTPNWGGF
jgi:hypothetical protein